VSSRRPLGIFSNSGECVWRATHFPASQSAQIHAAASEVVPGAQSLHAAAPPVLNVPVIPWSPLPHDRHQQVMLLVWDVTCVDY